LLYENVQKELTPLKACMDEVASQTTILAEKMGTLSESGNHHECVV
jgi:hypothetical protein